MNNDFTAKVLLTLYKEIPDAIRANEKNVIKEAMTGYYTRGCEETLRLMEKIINKNSQKIDLINLKLLIDKAFNLLLAEDLRIINMRFFSGMKFIEMADVLNVSLRQVFRMYDRAITSFVAQLEYLKYPAERIERDFGQLTVFQAACFKISNAYGILD